MSQLQEMKKYLEDFIKNDNGEGPFNDPSLYLSNVIMEFAHQHQTRENGQAYVTHPKRCFYRYRGLIGIELDEYACIDKALMAKYGIPYTGVEEVCLLHDVLEDSEVTMEDIEALFEAYDLGHYFRLYIKDALAKITHIKSMDYLAYILICMENPVSAMVKMLDLHDNTNVLSLLKFDEDYYKRTSGYLAYLYLINSKYHFIENIAKYKSEFLLINQVKYLTFENEKVLYVESADRTYLKYDSSKHGWIDATTEVWDTQFGYDASEPEGSPYRFGNGSCMKTIKYINKADAETMIRRKIYQGELLAIFKDIIRKSGWFSS